ncbi:hypothetical protein [Sediminibacterium sp.]|uniref:hypothetical protein n=1 Tax=Sediminibacterium sp. TaxID=1917865 RepID=UPI0027336DE6|nr:hypothetical protein [Sediminibacterium sp.]MDP3567282.1 hypothetical protein [Sediminibacterium sp.]
MKNFSRFGIIILATVFILTSCGGDDEKFIEKKENSDTIPVKIKPDISAEVINDIIMSIPSPLEMATMLKDNGQGYDANLLNPSTNIIKYNTNYKIAFNIGVYSADLGYINIYEKTFSAMSYLQNIKKLGDDIHIGQFFDFETLKRLATNTKNYDSLIFISTDNFNKMDAHLRTQNRNELSVLMISGAWLEGVNIACQVAKLKPNKDLTERLGFEKINLDNILVILNAYKNDEYFGKIVTEFEKLKQIYSQITISYTYVEPETKEVNGQLVIVNKSKSTVDITDEQLKQIIDEIARVRNTMIN